MDVMLSKAKHLVFSGCYKVEILRLTPQNDIATQSPTGEDRGEGSRQGRENTALPDRISMSTFVGKRRVSSVANSMNSLRFFA